MWPNGGAHSHHLQGPGFNFYHINTQKSLLTVERKKHVREMLRGVTRIILRPSTTIMQEDHFKASRWNSNRI